MPEPFIPNADIQAEACSICGVSWKRCLQGYADDRDDGPHPAGVCCRDCHEVDTHNAAAARQAERSRRATQSRRDLVERTATLGAARDEVRRLEALISQPVSGQVRRLEQRVRDLEADYGMIDSMRSQLETLRAENRRLAMEVTVANRATWPIQMATIDQLLDELRRRLNT